MNNNDYNSNLKIGQLPELKILPVENLVFHEDADQERLLNMVSRLGSEAILKNPPIVARINNNEKYMILDGANRTTALIRLGFKHIPVQVVSFEDNLLALHCWHHAIEKLDRNYFMEKLSALPDIRIVEREPFFVNNDERQMLAEEEDYLCRLIFHDRSVIGVKSDKSFIEKIKLLNSITGYYLSTHLSDRVSYINLEHLKKHYPDFRTLITFRRLDKNNLLEIINSDVRIPAGITRVFLPKRALGLNIQLEFLKSDLNLEDKNHWLDEMILEKVRSKSIRFYREPTFVFDE